MIPLLSFTVIEPCTAGIYASENEKSVHKNKKRAGMMIPDT